MSLINYKGESKVIKRICALLKVTDVQENGVSIVDANGVAHVTGGGGGSSTLAGLDDVNLSSPADGQTLIYDSTNTEWVNGDILPFKITENTTLGGYDVTYPS